MSVLKAKGICKAYLAGDEKIDVLKNIDLIVEKGERLAVIGPSGSGKSTLLNILSGLDRCDRGEIIFNGEDICKYNEEKLSALRLFHFGFVFQSYHLVGTLNAFDNIIVPKLARKEKVDEAYLDELCGELNLRDRLSHYPHQLSGGEQQRVAIARALVNKPDIIFSDEATGNLDYANSKNVMDLFIRCCEKYGQTLIYVTHDMALTHYAGKVLNLGGNADETRQKDV